MQPREAFSLKVMAELINGMGYDRVTICDPHSDVAPALVESAEIISQLELVRAHTELQPMLNGMFASIIAPDAGAAKKALTIAKLYGKPLVTATKVRDVVTGEITGTEIHGQVLGRNAIIVDDICDGGRTFIELAKVLRHAGAEKVFLYVTHGIFSQGFSVFDGLIDGIFTTDSFIPAHSTDSSSIPVRVHNLTF